MKNRENVIIMKLYWKQTFTYTQVWNANSDRVQDDVEEGDEACDPECKDQENEQPEDWPDDFRHFDSVELKNILQFIIDNQTTTWQPKARSDNLIDFSMNAYIALSFVKLKHTKRLVSICSYSRV